MNFLLSLLIATASLAASLDEQIVQANKSADSLRVVAQQLGSKKAALRIDSLFQADATLKAAGVKIVAGDKDSVWVKLVLPASLSDLDLRSTKVELKEGGFDFTEVAPDTLYMRRDRAEKVLPVISAALKE